LSNFTQPENLRFLLQVFHRQRRDNLGALIRTRYWAAALTNGAFTSVEQLAATAELHPKVVRKQLRLAFLAPGHH